MVRNDRLRMLTPLTNRAFAPIVVLVALTLLAYFPAMNAGFIWDDPDYVTQNATLRSLAGLQQLWFSPRSIPQYYPMAHTTFWIEYQLWGLWSPGYHVVNIALHAANAVLLYAILRKLRLPAAWLAAAVFALHPVHVESVAWITERKNVLSGLFYLAAMAAYLESVFGFRVSGFGKAKDGKSPSSLPEPRTPNPETRFSNPETRFYFLSLTLFALALLSKTVTCSLPAALLLIIWWKRGRLTWRDLTPLIPFFLIGAALAYMTAHYERIHVGASGAEFDFSAIERVLIAGRAVWFYVTKLLLPVNLSFIYPRWDIDARQHWLLIFPLAAALTVIALLFLRRSIGRGPLVAALFFGGTLVPALGFVNVYPMRYAFVADHFQYLASIGPIALFVGCVGAITRSRPYFFGFVVLILLGLATFQQSRVYRNTETLWTDTARKNPNSWMVHTNLGHALVARETFDEAQHHYETALKLAPHLPEPHWNVGIGLSVRGDLDGALRHFDEAIRLEPNFPQGYYSRGTIYHARGQLDAAIAQYQKAIALKPDYAEAHYNLGVIAEGRKRIDNAIDAYRSAVANRLDYEAAHFSLANLLFTRGRFDEALIHYAQVIRINARRADAHLNIGATFLQLGRYEDAHRAFTAALAIDPTLTPARRGLERATQLRGRRLP